MLGGIHMGEERGVKTEAGMVGGAVVLPEGKAKLNKGMKWFSGCGLGCMGLVLVLFVVGWWVNSNMRAEQQQRLQKLFDQYQSEGYHLVQKEVQVVESPLVGKHILNARTVTIKADCPAGVVIIADECLIDATLTGPVIFRGSQLTLGSSAVLPSLTGEAYLFENKGKVADNQLKIIRK